MTKSIKLAAFALVSGVIVTASVVYGVCVTKENRKLERQIDLISDKFEECINDYKSSQDNGEDDNTLDS